MEIIPPFGYKKITPLLKDMRTRVNLATLPDFARQRNAIPLTLSEVSVAGHDFPVVFTPAGEGQVALVGVLGLEAGENLFAQPQGWAPGVYLPAHIRRYPYCMTRFTVNGVAQGQLLVCIEEDFISPDGVAHYDEKGNPSPQWAEFQGFLNQFEMDIERTREVCSILADLKLLDGMTAQVETAGRAFSLSGLLRIDEKRLEQLTSGQIKTLLRKGGMALIYQHLASLTRFKRLGDLKGARLGPLPVPPPVPSPAPQ